MKITINSLIYEVKHDNGKKVGTIEYDTTWNKWYFRADGGFDIIDLEKIIKFMRHL